jgi:hypothetical protein
MQEDDLRDKMDFSLYCSEHPEEKLKYSAQLSRVGASSAYEVNIKIRVHQCRLCKRKLEDVKNALGVFNSIMKNGM